MRRRHFDLWVGLPHTNLVRRVLMKSLCRIVAALIFLVVTVIGAQTSSAAQGKVRESMIVSTDWLEKQLKDDNLILLQVGEKKEYEAAHIPGAQFIQLADISTPRGQG